MYTYSTLRSELALFCYVIGDNSRDLGEITPLQVDCPKGVTKLPEIYVSLPMQVSANALVTIIEIQQRCWDDGKLVLIISASCLTYSV